jgi:ketosteroid isomerase-like protein
MSQENVELVLQGIQSPYSFWALLDDDVVFDTRNYPTLAVEGGAVFVGREAAIETSRRYWGTWEAYHFDAEELIDAGSSVVGVVRERGRGRGSGVPVERRHAQVWTFRRGRIIRWEVFPDRAAALEAVGLTEEAMAQTNTEIVRRSFEAFQRRDLDAYLALMDPDVEITSRFVGQTTYHGHRGVREWWEDMLRVLPDTRVELQELHDLGDLVLLALRARGHGGGSAAPFDEITWMTAKARHGKCIWWHAHSTKAEALEAVGLPE